MHVPCARAAGPASATGSALAGCLSHADAHTGPGARSKRLRYGIQCSRMRLGARRPAQNHLAASRDSEAIKMSTRPGPRRLGCSRQRRDEGGLLPLAGSSISEPVQRCGPGLLTGTGVRAAVGRARCRRAQSMPTVPLVISCWACGRSGLADVLAHRQRMSRSPCRWLSSRPGSHPRSPDRFRRWPSRRPARWPCRRRR